MCEYCKKGKWLSEYNNGFGIFIDKSTIIIDNANLYDEIPISYCPMCRKEAGRVRAKYIKTMDFMFEKINILNCNNANELAERIKENEIIKIDNYGIIEYINSSYIMFYELEEEESYDK